MPLINQASLNNTLLRRLRPEDFALLAPHLKPVELSKGEVLAEPDQPLTQATFPERGIISMVTVSPDGHLVESGITGREGFWPSSVALGAQHSAYKVNVQMPGEGYRIAVGALHAAIAKSRPLHDLLLRFAHTLSVQISYTALSNAVHSVDERLARWLLMCHDRSPGGEIALTHEFLGIMLAVRRPSVTGSLHVLEGNRLIRAVRGCVTIRDRQGLEEFAHDAYGRPEAEYEQLIGTLGWQRPGSDRLQAESPVHGQSAAIFSH